ncbi:helix-turn-helix domain-containing protein [Methylobacterium oryzisoli]|uniref:helix-turn-helix domain-containing protein n=1 Tax=Methylobacterium oryzisoli TaxID=3385502 RepID=UPI0038927B6B
MIAATGVALPPLPPGPAEGCGEALPPLMSAPGLIGTRVLFGRRQEIFGAGEEARSVYRVISGAVHGFTSLADGRRQVNAFHLPGDVFGLGAGPLHSHSAEAVVETAAMVYPRRPFEEAARRDGHLAYTLWLAALRQLEHGQDHVLLLGRRSAVERVAAFLAQIERRSVGSGWFVLPMTRRDIADYLGLTIETVSRAVTRLEAEGALLRAGAKRIRLCHAALRHVMGD